MKKEFDKIKKLNPLKKNFEKAKHEFKPNYTVTIVPNTYGRRYTFTLSAFIVRNLAFVLAFLLIVLVLFICSYISMYSNYEQSKSDLLQLQSVNKEQQVQLYQIEELTTQIDQKIYYLDLLETKIKTLLGKDLVATKETKELDNALAALEEQMGDVGGTANEDSSYVDYYIFSSDASAFDKSEDLASMSQILNSLNESLKIQQDSYDSLKSQVVKETDYSASYPDYWPISGSISDYFGYRTSPYVGFHEGLDIAGNVGDPICAAGKGVVTFAGYQGSYGLVVYIDHGYGFETVYAHCSELLVSVGDEVNKADVIALRGNTGYSTGPHLHFEVRENGTQYDPLNYIKLRDGMSITYDPQLSNTTDKEIQTQ